jgi:hypothetical protein
MLILFVFMLNFSTRLPHNLLYGRIFFRAAFYFMYLMRNAIKRGQLVIFLTLAERR